MSSERFWVPGRLSFYYGHINQNFYCERPEGDFYWMLWGKALRIIMSSNRSEERKDLLVNNWHACLITAAARDQAIERSREALAMVSEWTPWTDIFWSELVLLRAVKRFADEKGDFLPDPLNSPKLAWGKMFLRDVSATCTGRDEFKSKRDLIARGRFEKSELKAGRNPYKQTDSPERFFLTQAILSAPKCSSSWKNGTKRAHKELGQAFKAYQNDLSKLATSLDRDEKWVVFDQNSKMILDRGYRRSMKPTSG